MPRAVIALTTLASRRDAERIARHLVQKKLAACVNLLPGAVSFYRWKKRLCRARETILMMKSSAGKVRHLERELKRVHPYELPEFIVLSIDSGSKKYLQWLFQQI